MVLLVPTVTFSEVIEFTGNDARVNGRGVSEGVAEFESDNEDEIDWSSDSTISEHIYRIR